MHFIDVARTHEILARYRPIAPKPALPPQAAGAGAPPGVENPSSVTPEKLAAAALQHLPPRSSRSRKRGRAGCSCIVSQKKPKTYVPVLPCPDVTLPFLASKTAQLGLSMQSPSQAFPVRPMAGPRFGGKMEKPVGSCADLLSLSLVPFSSSASGLAGPTPTPTPASGTNKEVKETTLDLNSAPEATPAETDLTLAPVKPQVIVPQPVRPVGSSISVGCISENKVDVPSAPMSKKPEEVEEEVESEVLPAVVSDSNNRVRLANSAYKEMVGQPECSWLEFMVGKGGARATAGSKRINGEVMLDLSGSEVPVSSKGFSCRVTIEWACNGRKTFIRAPCDVIKLFCESKDYLFAWRFHIEASDADCKA